MLSFLLQFCLSSLSYSFLFSWHGNSSKSTGTRVFGIPGMAALLPFSICRKRDMLCSVRGVASGQGFTCGTASWVGLRTLSVPRLQWNRDHLSKRLRTQCCLSVLSFTGMLLHLLPPPWTPPHQTGKYQPNCPDTVNHFLLTGAASLSMCFYLWNYNCTLFLQSCLLCLCRIWANMLEQ